jgi:flavin-binding protein dodecin
MERVIRYGTSPESKAEAKAKAIAEAHKRYQLAIRRLLDAQIRIDEIQAELDELGEPTE